MWPTEGLKKLNDQLALSIKAVLILKYLFTCGTSNKEFLKYAP